MRAYAVVRPVDPAIEEVELPLSGLGPREVRLRVSHAGVCHSDVHLRTGFHDLGGEGRVPLAERGFSYPLVLGHEIVGVVEDVGSAVDGVAAGDVRLVYPWLGCGTCRRCRAGADNLCPTPRTIGANLPGGYAETVTVPDARYLLSIDGVDPSTAATLACSGLTAYGAALKIDAPKKAPVVVNGVGGVGLALVAILRSLGHETVCALDVSAKNLAVAEQLGATHSVLIGEDPLAQVRDVIKDPIDTVIDLVNNGSTLRTGFELLAKGGSLVSVGLFGGEMRLPTVMLPLKAVRIIGSYVGSLSELSALVQVARSGTLPTVPVLAGALDRDGVAHSLDQLAAGAVQGRIVLRG